MANKLKYKAVATTGEYTNKEGETKKRYTQVGVVFENDKGQLSLKLDAVPLSKEWSGFINFYEPDGPGQSRQQGDSGGGKKVYPSGYKPSEDQSEDEIPF